MQVTINLTESEEEFIRNYRENNDNIDWDLNTDDMFEILTSLADAVEHTETE